MWLHPSIIYQVRWKPKLFQIPLQRKLFRGNLRVSVIPAHQRRPAPLTHLQCQLELPKPSKIFSYFFQSIVYLSTNVLYFILYLSTNMLYLMCICGYRHGTVVMVYWWLLRMINDQSPAFSLKKIHRTQRTMDWWSA